MRRFSQFIFRGELKLVIDGENNILTRLWLDAFDLTLNMAAAVHDHFAITIAAAQVLVVNRLNSVLADNVAGLIFFVFVTLIFELLGANLLHIAEDVRQRSVRRISSLRCLLYAQRRQFQLMCINPRDVRLRRILFNQDRFERRL